jgi:uncharacterized damage-inducible protein DinB
MSDNQGTPVRPPIADDITDDQLIARYLAGTALVRDTIAGMRAEQLHARPIEGKMSTQEVVTHIVDSEAGMGGRIRRAIAGEEVPLAQGRGGHPEPASDPSRDVVAELQRLAEAREQLAEEMQQLPADAWDLVAIRREDRVMTVRQVFTLLVRHVENHVAAIEEKRAALGL